jgi:hypothetical protein
VEIPDRAEGTFAFDVNTQELARAVAEELHSRTGRWPHLIICRLHRRKVDCNRELAEAAAGNPLAEQAWREFQGFIDAAQEQVIRQHGRGLYIDLHGHGHANQRLELGYLHSVQQLAQSDAELSAPQFAAESSLRAIAIQGRLPYAELLRGPASFGALMEQRGFPCSPSPTNSHPEAPYFRGGYNTQRHGRDAAPLAGLQIETYSRGVRESAASRKKFAQALAGTLETFFELHIGLLLAPKPRPTPLVTVPPQQTAAACCEEPARRPRCLARLTCRFGRVACR